jgi:hypothetical protein
MAEDRIEGVGLVAEKDLETGLLHIYADVLGQLVPVASEKLGLLGTHEPSQSGDPDSPSESKASRSRKTS